MVMVLQAEFSGEAGGLILTYTEGSGTGRALLIEGISLNGNDNV